MLLIDTPAKSEHVESRRLRWFQQHGPETLGIATSLLFVALFFRVEPSPDVAWQLWIAHQLRHGSRLYTDIIETNPPLWFWIAMPLDWAAERLGVGIGMVAIAATGFASALSIFATGRLLQHIPAPMRAALLVFLSLVLLLMPLSEMEQREQLLLIGAVPYIVLAAMRRDRRAISPMLAIAVGIGSALGFALKHYFLITPLLIELWLVVGLRRSYRPYRPETVVLGLMALVYAISVQAFAPNFLSRMVPMLRLVYGATDAPHFSDMIRLTQYCWAFLAAILLLHPRLTARAPLAAGMAIAAIGFAAAWLIQHKGWPYHSIPTTGCLMLAVAFLAATYWPMLSPLAWVTTPTALALPLALSAWVGPYRDVLEPVTRPLLAGIGPQDGVAIVSEVEAYAWPLTLRRNMPYPSRYYGMWILHALVTDHGRTPAVVQLARHVVEETAQDYRCAQPVRIIFDQHDRGGFDLEQYFTDQPSFAELMSHYRHVGTYRYFDIYQRIAPFPKPLATACRRGV